jgi:hypothetical protein
MTKAFAVLNDASPGGNVPAMTRVKEQYAEALKELNTADVS